ncbi:MAG: ATP-binding protein [Dehalogenimonas sp.]
MTRDKKLPENSAPQLKHAYKYDKLEAELRIYQAELEMQNEMLRETETALEESRELYRQLFNLAPLAYLVIDSNHMITLINSSGALLLNSNPTNLYHERFTRFIAPGDQDRFHIYLNKIHSQNRPQQSVDVAIKPDNHPEIQVAITAIRTGLNGENFLLTAMDVTERLEMLNKLNGQRTELSDLSRKLLSVQEEERRNISMELHDEIGQQLTVLKLIIDTQMACQTEACKEGIKKASEHVGRIISSVRNLSAGLYPSMLTLLGLETTLRALFDNLQSTAQLKIDFQCDLQGIKLDNELKLAIYRVVQEALTNAIRYSGVHEVKVSIRDSGDWISLTIKDEGKGFDGSLSNKNNGLNSMRERVMTLGGDFNIKSKVGLGTTIEVELPKIAGSKHECLP